MLGKRRGKSAMQFRQALSQLLCKNRTTNRTDGAASEASGPHHSSGYPSPMPPCPEQDAATSEIGRIRLESARRFGRHIRRESTTATDVLSSHLLLISTVERSWSQA